MFRSFYFNEYENFNDLNFVSLSYSDIDHEPSLLHSHSNTEILILSHGEGEIIHDGTPIPMTLNNVYVINPLTLHSEIKKPNKDLRYYVLKIKNFSIQREKTQSIVSIPIDVTLQTLLSTCLNQIITELDAQKIDSLFIVKSFLQIIYNYVLRVFIDNDLLISESNKINLSNNNSIAKTIKNYIEQNYQYILKIEDVAAHFGLTHNNLIKIFRSSYGVTPKNFLIYTKIHASLYVLETTDYTVSQVSSFCGFNFSSYYSKQFMKIMKTTPSKYRKEHSNIKK